MTRLASSPIAAMLGALAAFCLAAALPQPAVAQQHPKPQQADKTKDEPADTQEQRLRQLEDQMLDLQAMIGALQSLAKQPQPDATAPTPPQPNADTGDLAQRVDVIETQIRALAGQLEQITGQLSQIQAALAGGPQPQAPGAPPPEGVQPQAQPLPGDQQPASPQQSQTFGTLQVRPDQPQLQPWQPPQPQPPAEQPQVPQTPPGTPQLQSPQAADPNPQSRAAYETAYNHLLQRDFESAEEGFRSFVASNPDDPLAGNALYWLGETYFVRGKYREAANTFLAGYRKYRDSDKAPASLLKLGMALKELGEKDAACATFSELGEKFPGASAHLKQRAASERSRAGC